MATHFDSAYSEIMNQRRATGRQWHSRPTRSHSFTNLIFHGPNLVAVWYHGYPLNDDGYPAECISMPRSSVGHQAMQCRAILQFNRSYSWLRITDQSIAPKHVRHLHTGVGYPRPAIHPTRRLSSDEARRFARRRSQRTAPALSLLTNMMGRASSTFDASGPLTNGDI